MCVGSARRQSSDIATFYAMKGRKKRDNISRMEQTTALPRRAARYRRRHRTLIGSLLLISFFGRGSLSSAFLHIRPAIRARSTSWHSRRRVTSSGGGRDVTDVSLDTVAIVNEFVGTVKQSLEDETFVSLMFKGPTVSKKQRQNTSIKERLRGCIRQIHARLISLPKRNSVCLQATIKYHGATDVAKNYNMNQVVPGLTSLILSNSDVVASEWGENAFHPLGSELGIQSCKLQTTLGTWELTAVHTKPTKLKFHKSADETTTVTGTQPMSHDRTKYVPLSTRSSYLQALGLTSPDGKPRPSMSSKLKQCQKFVEIVSGLIESSLAGRDVSTLNIVDMGCGRGYLTFALHTFLYETYGTMVQSCGIDMRPKLIKEISEIARSLGSDFDGLTFQEGTIEAFLSNPQEKDSSSLDILIALHACDTATDDALWSGIQRECDVLVVAPCCHKEARRQLDRHVASVKSDHPLADVLRHNIYRERMAETATDSLRALLLELANYYVQVFEFIGGEHTGKNTMITAVKRRRSRSKKELAELRERLCSLASLHGVHEQRLANWMDETLEHVNGEKAKQILSSKEMPPLQ